MRKLFLVALATILLLSCGCSFTVKQEEAEKPETVGLYMQEGFIPEEILAAFTKETGIKVKCYNLSDAKVVQKKLETGISPFDLIIGDNIMLESLSAEADVLHTVDASKLSNYSQVSAHTKALPEYAREYAIPYMRTCTVFVHDVMTTRAPITSYASMWAPYFKERISVAEAPRLMTSIALKSKGHPINTTEAALLDDAKNTLCALKYNTYTISSTSPAQDVANGISSLAVVWAQDAGAAKQKKPALEILYPSDGALMQMTCMMISKTAPNMENAYLLADYLLRADNSVQACMATKMESLNAEAAEDANDAYLSMPAVHMGKKHDATAEYLHYVADTEIYDEIWNAFAKTQKTREIEEEKQAEAAEETAAAVPSAS